MLGLLSWCERIKNFIRKKKKHKWRSFKRLILPSLSWFLRLRSQQDGGLQTDQSLQLKNLFLSEPSRSLNPLFMQLSHLYVVFTADVQHRSVGLYSSAKLFHNLSVVSIHSWSYLSVDVWLRSLVSFMKKTIIHENASISASTSTYLG